jgi:hypothetical protein
MKSREEEEKGGIYNVGKFYGRVKIGIEFILNNRKAVDV